MDTKATSFTIRGRKIKKKFLFGAVAGIIVLVISVVIISRYAQAEDTTEEVMTKETQVEKGNLTTGVTESSTTTLESVDLIFESPTSSSGTSTSSSSSTSTTDASSTAAAAGGTTGTTDSSSATGTTSSSSTSSSTSSSSVPSLAVEKVYVATGDSVEEGDAILKVTDDSYAAVQKYLNDAISSAKLAVTNAEIERDAAQAEADSTLEENQAMSSIAQEEYNNTVAKLTEAVTTAQDNLNEAQTEIATYQTNIANNTYADEYKVDEIADQITAKKAEIADLKKQKKTATGTALATIEESLTKAETELTSLQSSYEQAKSNAENALSEAQTKLADLQDSLTSLQNSVNEAATAKEKGILEAQATLDQENITVENATSLYNIAVDGIDDDVNSAKETLENAQADLATFTEMINSNAEILANASGLVTAINFEAADEIASGSTIATFGDAENVTIAVDVDQEDIASITTDSQVNVTFTAYPEATYTAEVIDISTTASSTNSSTVTYPVTVRLTGDVSALYEGMTGNVTFVTKELTDVLYVSNKAITTEDTKSYVNLKKEDGTTEKVEVTTGFSDGSNVEITDGLEEGDTVVIESQVSK